VEVGSKVTVLLPLLKVIPPLTAASFDAKVKLAFVRVVISKALEKVTVISANTDTPVASSDGEVEATVGALELSTMVVVVVAVPSSTVAVHPSNSPMDKTEMANKETIKIFFFMFIPPYYSKL